MLTRGSLKNGVLLQLNKTAKTKGFFTEDRLDNAIQMALDMVATECFVGGNGFMNKIKYVDVQQNQCAIPIPRDVAYINAVRYLVGNIYEPCMFSEDRERPQWDNNNNAGAQLYPYTYRIVDNCIYFNPPIIQGGAKFLQLETTVWPKMPANDSDYFDVAIGPAMKWFMILAASTLCVNQNGQPVPDWQELQAYWYDKLKEVIQRRNNQAQRIQDFC